MSKLLGIFKEWYGTSYNGYWVNGLKDGFGEFDAEVSSEVKQKLLELDSSNKSLKKVNSYA